MQIWNESYAGSNIVEFSGGELCDNASLACKLEVSGKERRVIHAFLFSLPKWLGKLASWYVSESNSVFFCSTSQKSIIARSTNHLLRTSFVVTYSEPPRIWFKDLVLRLDFTTLPDYLLFFEYLISKLIRVQFMLWMTIWSFDWLCTLSAIRAKCGEAHNFDRLGSSECQR